MVLSSCGSLKVACAMKYGSQNTCLWKAKMAAAYFTFRALGCTKPL